MSRATLHRRIDELSEEQVSEVERLVIDLTELPDDTDRQLVRAAPRLASRSLSRVWDNPDDAVYNEL